MVYDCEKWLGGDLSRAALITGLYALQGIPLGLVHGSLPYLLKKHLTYTDLAVFSFASYPYLFKLLWSPLVDSHHIPYLGRRKSWIIPCQLLMGVLFLLSSPYIDTFLQAKEHLYTLTGLMFTLILLAATQDIAVDAWAVELLEPENKALGSTCQSLGQYVGFFVSFPVMIVANSAEFSAMYFSTTEALLPVSGFFYLCGYMFIAFSLYVQFLIPETNSSSEPPASLLSILSSMLHILKLPHMQSLVALLLTVRLGLAAFDSVLMLQLVEHGMDEVEMGALSMALIPVEIAITIAVGWRLSKGFSLSGYRIGYLIRIAANVIILLVLLNTDKLVYPWYFPILISCLLGAIGSNMMFSVITSLFFRVSQHGLSGTYMTFLATVLNLGSQVPNTLALWTVDLLSSEGTCEGLEKPCKDARNGFYPLALGSIVVSLVYFAVVLTRKTKELELLETSDWHYNKTKST
jgi:hypothetical protein